MPTYVYTVEVTTDTVDQADQVMAERIEPNEDYGFDYTIHWERPVPATVKDEA